jgi:hypothetical protein
MCKDSLLQNTGLFSTFYIGKSNVLLSFFNVNEQIKKRKEKMQKTKNRKQI